MKIGYIPLDERPANTRYPKLIAEIADVQVFLPPSDTWSDFRGPADTDGLVAWLEREATEYDTLVVSCEMLGYGSLIQSRISHDPVEIIIQRLQTLHRLKQRNSRLRIFGFNLITRISYANSATEEPDYWADYGANLYLYSQLLDRAHQGQLVTDELRTLRTQLPDDCVNDFLARRLRNHIINLTVLQMLADGVFDLLVMSSDDTSPYGLGSREKSWVNEWLARMELERKLLMYPGADEVGSVLVARAINEHYGKEPTFQVEYVVPEGANITAAFEDSPVAVTVERQIHAAGGVFKADDDANILFIVNPPLNSRPSWPSPYTEVDFQQRTPQFQRTNERIAAALDAGRFVAVADVANANGADTMWVKMLQQAGLLQRLDAYSAWNTAGNSIGTTVAQSCLAWQFGRTAVAQQKFQVHRLIEDWAYQGIVRQQLSHWLQQQTGSEILPVDLIPGAAQWTEAALMDICRQELPDLAFHIVPGSVRFPWRRTFEIDFELQMV
jgi:hypothetical protein